MVAPSEPEMTPASPASLFLASLASERRGSFTTIVVDNPKSSTPALPLWNPHSTIRRHLSNNDLPGNRRACRWGESKESSSDLSQLESAPALNKLSKSSSFQVGDGALLGLPTPRRNQEWNPSEELRKAPPSKPKSSLQRASSDLSQIVGSRRNSKLADLKPRSNFWWSKSEPNSEKDDAQPRNHRSRISKAKTENHAGRDALFEQKKPKRKSSLYRSSSDEGILPVRPSLGGHRSLSDPLPAKNGSQSDDEVFGSPKPASRSKDNALSLALISTIERLSVQAALTVTRPPQMTTKKAAEMLPSSLTIMNEASPQTIPEGSALAPPFCPSTPEQ